MNSKSVGSACFFLATISFLFSAITFANPCYRTTGIIWPIGGCPPCKGIGQNGPCPSMPALGPPQLCGYTDDYYPVPNGTSGNEPAGKMNQGPVKYVCGFTTVCTLGFVPSMPPLFPPISQWACIAGPPVPCPGSNYTSFVATGSVCPPPSP